MKLLTLTPDVRVYLAGAVVVYALACAPAAANLQLLWPGKRMPRFPAVYVVTMVAVAVVAVSAFKLPSLTRTAPSALGLSLAAGVAGGTAASWCDQPLRRILRRMVRRRAAGGSPLAMRPSVAVGAARTPAVGTISSATVTDLILLLMIALLEEILFRGVLVDFSLGVASPVLAGVCITGTIVAFAGAHVYLGWPEMVAKLPLALTALAASLPFRAVAGAVVVHLVFNARAWWATRSFV